MRETTEPKAGDAVGVSPLEAVVMPVLHLKTQHGQPYGSVRRCCEECGIMIWGNSLPDGHRWTEDLGAWENAEGLGYMRCTDVRHNA